MRNGAAETSSTIPIRWARNRPQLLAEADSYRSANARNFVNGPYWARTSDLRLVEPALSQLS